MSDVVRRRDFLARLLGAGLAASRGLPASSGLAGGFVAVPTSLGGELPVTLTPRRQPATPAELHRALLAGFDARLLPPGFSNPKVADVTYGRTWLVGAVNVELDGPSYRDLIWYEVYASDEQALARFEDGDFGRRAISGGTGIPSVLAEPLEVASPNRTRVSETFVPDGFAGPAWGVVASTQIGGRPWGWTSCTVLMGNVVVSAQSMLGAPSYRGNDADAIALAQTAVTQLRRITGAP